MHRQSGHELWTDNARLFPRFLVITLQDGLGEFQQVIQVVNNNGNGDGQLQGLVVVYRDIAKIYHGFKSMGQRQSDPTTIGQQIKNPPRPLGHTQTFPTDQVLSHVKRGCTGTLNIEDGGILAGKIGRKALPILVILFPSTRHTPFDNGGLVE